jgi:chemotaxis protein histidine kinase CheA
MQKNMGKAGPEQRRKAGNAERGKIQIPAFSSVNRY